MMLVCEIYPCNVPTTNIYEIFFTMFALQEQLAFISAFVFFLIFSRWSFD